MKRLLLASALLAFACAASAQSTDAAADEPEEAQNNTRVDARAKANERVCIQQTGSRIVAARNKSNDDETECVAAGGRVYTRADIESTGSVDLADALRKLDPSIR